MRKACCGKFNGSEFKNVQKSVQKYHSILIDIVLVVDTERYLSLSVAGTEITSISRLFSS